MFVFSKGVKKQKKHHKKRNLPQQTKGISYKNP